MKQLSPQRLIVLPIALSIAVCTNATAFSMSSPKELMAVTAKLATANGLPADVGYSLLREHPGEAGNKIIRFGHTYKNIPIWQGESVVVVDPKGNLLTESASNRRNHLLEKANTLNLNLKPFLTSEQAIHRTVQGIAPNGRHTIQPEAELIIYPLLKNVRRPGMENKRETELNAADVQEIVTGYELAYLVKTRLYNNSDIQFHDSIISAVDARVLQRIEAKHSIQATGNSQYSGQVQLETSVGNNLYQMVDPLRGTNGNRIYNANNSGTLNTDCRSYPLYTDGDNNWGDSQQYAGGSTMTSNGQTAAVDAMWGSAVTYDMLNNVLRWRGIDGRNTEAALAVHYGNGLANAYWVPQTKCILIGDGGSISNSFTAPDIIAHEIGHGLTSSTANLTYAGESGGLNESNSDILGDMVEAYGKGNRTSTTLLSGNNWQHGNQISQYNVPTRYMIKPSKDWNSPDAWYYNIGNIDVHYSSGPNNRMFYFLSQGSSAVAGADNHSSYLRRLPLAMTGIGNDKALRIWFRALTTKFTSSTNYWDAFNKVLAAANELYGVGSKEAVAVRRAYAAINVGMDYNEIGYGLNITAEPVSRNVIQGTWVPFSVIVESGQPPYQYQWRRNGQPIPGATSSSYAKVAELSDNNVTYTVTITDSGTVKQSATSAPATLTVYTNGCFIACLR